MACTNGEILYTIIGGSSKEEGIASTSTEVINSFVGYKSTHNIYLNNQMNKYSELYFKPTVGISGTSDYGLKSTGATFFKKYESHLVAYDLK